MAAQIKQSYPEIYKANEYAHDLKKDEIQSKLRAILGAAKTDTVIPNITGTFLELVKLADFSAAPVANKSPEAATEEDRPKEEDATLRRKISTSHLGLSYTINLNLPATTEIEVFNAIFKSLKEHLLDG